MRIDTDPCECVPAATETVLHSHYGNRVTAEGFPMEEIARAKVRNITAALRKDGLSPLVLADLEEDLEIVLSGQMSHRM